MKGLLTAFTILSFVAASSVPMLASAADMNHDQPMSDQGATGADHSTAPAPAMHSKTTHRATHHVTHHKRTVHHKTHHKHTAKVKHHKLHPSPKEG
jgi:Ni/Co efflux regulator RcnB